MADPNPDPPAPAVQQFLAGRPSYTDRMRQATAADDEAVAARESHGLRSAEFRAATARRMTREAAVAAQLAADRRHLVEHLYPARPPVAVRHNLADKPAPFTRATAAYAVAAVDFVARVLPAGRELNLRFVRMTKGDAEGEAGTVGGLTTIALRRTIVGPKAVVHEIGHAAEDQRPDIRRAARTFLDRRTAGESSLRLQPMTAGVRYGFPPNTRGRKDRFDRLFPDPVIAHYVGTEYDDGGTEVFSHGLAEMYNDSVRFATLDPDYFHFILTALNPTRG